jgi:hypothetical protein
MIPRLQIRLPVASRRAASSLMAERALDLPVASDTVSANASI